MLNLKYPYTLNDVYESAKEKRFTVISTFSGGGGSSIGYKLAGGDVLLANEFVDVAAETYKLNFPSTPVLIGDIRELTGKDFLDASNLKSGELDVLDGSPPCSAFSVSGKRDKGWNKEKKYSTDKTVKNIEDLFLDFIRITNDIKPKIVIAENVAGLQQGEARKKLNLFTNEFEKIGYVVNYETIDAQHFGVPQTRARTIIIGVRKDIYDISGNIFPNNFFPQKLNTIVTVREAFADLYQTEEEIKFAKNIVKTDSVINKVINSYPVENNTNRLMDATYACPKLTNNGKSFFSMRKLSWNLPCPCLTATVTLSGNIHPSENRKLTTKESYRIMCLPDDYKNTGTYVQQLERVGRMHSPFPLAHVSDHIVRTYLGK